MRPPILVRAAMAVLAAAIVTSCAKHRADRGAIPLATPPGVTLEHVSGYQDEVFADEHGMSLYVHVDASGRPTADCTPDCGAERTAALASRPAAGGGDWSLRTAGAGRQWMYRGAALYRYAGDVAIGDLHGTSDSWHPALYRADSGVELRTGIGVRQIEDAGGAVLVDADGLTLYGFSGELRDVIPARWVPLQAPAIARPSADFSVISRRDGISQWAYRGRPLFRFEEDRQPLDLSGVGVDPRFEAALVRREFRPANVEIRRLVPWGDLLTTSAGAVLYQRDRVSTTNEGHSFREDHGTPALGRSLGTATCDAACTATWLPLAAPEDALPSGHWSIAVRPEGTRQWVYKGFAVYTYAHDVPGEALGNAIYDLAPVQTAPSAPGALAPTGGSRDDGLPVHGVAQRVGGGLSAFFWHAVIP